ncbi:MAG: type II secretion system protein [Planctomycetes bacterium]|nr:type II secretion system protein [Planctomycetota bacterium]
MSRKPHRSRVRSIAWIAAGRGFTLIEILVVVAIIALLIAVLIPALTVARNQARMAVCASNMKQALTGVITHIVEQNMRKERVSTNFGWATPAFRANSEMGQVFSCPSDPHPRPMPPLLVDVYDGGYSIYHGRTSSDGVFNHLNRISDNQWTLDIQDTVDARGFGRDSGTNDIDVLLQYSASQGIPITTVSVKQVESAWDFRVFNHKGQTLWANPKSSGGTSYRLPLMWMSFAANAAAGLRSTKGSPLLLVEAAKPGIFPESYAGRGSYGGGQPNDDLKQKLRFRHGPRIVKKGYSDPDDREYVTRERMNGGFLDGHVENLLWSRIIGKEPQIDGRGDLLWHRDIWLGIRRSDDNSFD